MTLLEFLRQLLLISGVRYGIYCLCHIDHYKQERTPGNGCRRSASGKVVGYE
jgi:hypothetical protein